VAAAVLGGGGCRGTDELVQSIAAHIFVVGVEGDAMVQLDIEGQRVRGVPDGDDNLVAFSLALDEGQHAGTVTVFEVERRRDDRSDDDDDDDDDDEVNSYAADELRAEHCGPFVIDVVAGAEPSALAIVVDDLPRCGEEPADDDGGDSDVQEEGGTAEEDEDPATGEGEGEPPDDGEHDEAGEGEGEHADDDPSGDEGNRDENGDGDGGEGEGERDGT
jgi:hypothetical protein